MEAATVGIRSLRHCSNHEVAVSKGRVLQVTPVFDTYWAFAAERQDLFMRRILGESPPWTHDPVLAAHRFTNVYRAADRVSQYLIGNVIYRGTRNEEDIFFRTLLFKFFNRIETWEELRERVGDPSWKTFDFERYAQVFDSMIDQGKKVYSAAYIMPSPCYGNSRKHRNHLRLLEHMMRDGAPSRLAKARSLEQVFKILRCYPSVGNFLAYQLTIDLNYSEWLDFSEMEFVVAGPGAEDGIQKCFAETAGFSYADIIRMMIDRAEGEFKRLGLTFRSLWGRPLQLVDCQNLFCEVGKYARMVHPEFRGTSHRFKIKQKFKPNSNSLPQWYPPKWGLKIPATVTEYGRRKLD